ncbi:M48 family metallopeptidase [Micromonospora sp. NPDC000207]|uniref:M48 family metallopeptidase n=1 Tax=Micromonospora sp. NPDC000207 TaxID=3154246 RepID=UPI0033276A93
MNVSRSDEDRCPRCDRPTVSLRDALPWCAACEWNLDAFDPAVRRPEFGWSWVDRRTYRLARGLTGRQYATLVDRELDAAGFGPAGWVTAVASLLLTVGVLALGGTGVWLLFAYPFPNLAILLGVIMIGLAVALRPRFGRVDPDLEVLDRDRAPELHALVAEVAEAIGAPVPHVIGVDDTFNAYATSVGLRRRRVLALGLPLWGSLDGPSRVALLGHELGHFVNGDVRRILVVQPALTMLGNAADLMRPSAGTSGGGLVEMIGEAVGRSVSWTVSRVLFGAHLVLVATALRDSQRAEYLADEMAARSGGTDAATRVLDVTLHGESVLRTVRRVARDGGGPARWRAEVDLSLASAADRLTLLRQLSLREETSLFASHPPAGLRHRMLTARTRQAPRVVVTEARVELIDGELRRHYDRTVRDIALGG